MRPRRVTARSASRTSRISASRPTEVAIPLIPDVPGVAPATVRGAPAAFPSIAGFPAQSSIPDTPLITHPDVHV